MSQENGAFFVMTNMIITPSQTQGTCPEDPKERDVICTRDSDCLAGTAVEYGHGKLENFLHGTNTILQLTSLNFSELDCFC